MVKTGKIGRFTFISALQGQEWMRATKGTWRHQPELSGTSSWLDQARDTINARGGLADAEKGVLVGRVTKNEAEMRVRDCFAGDFLNNVRLAVSRSELHFIAPALGSRMPERHLEVAVSGGSSLTWRIETDVPWLSCVPSSGSGNRTVIVLAHPAGLEPGKHTGRITIHCPGAINSPQPVSVVLNISERPRKADSGSGS